MIDLPGRPFTPTRDEFGAAMPTPPPTADGGGPPPPAIQHAVCVYVVLKREASLDYVRQNALIVCPQSVATPPARQNNPTDLAAGQAACPPPSALDRNGRIRPPI